MPTTKTAPTIMCPSVASIGLDGQTFGMLTGSSEEGFLVGYLSETAPAKPELLSAAATVKPTEIFRAAATGMDWACKHWNGANWRLAARITTKLDPAVSALPRCAIRPTCRWFPQEGRHACLRCFQLPTKRRNATKLQCEVAG